MSPPHPTPPLPPPGTLSQLKTCPFTNTPGSFEDPMPGEGDAGPGDPEVTTGTRHAPRTGVRELSVRAKGQQRQPAVPRMRGQPRPRSGR